MRWLSGFNSHRSTLLSLSHARRLTARAKNRLSSLGPPPQGEGVQICLPTLWLGSADGEVVDWALIVYLSICLSIYLSISLPTYLPACLSNLPTYLSIYLSISIYLSPRSGVLRMQTLRTPLVGPKGYQSFPLFKPGVGI